ncbi:hypothetical protein GCM10007888_62380 [Methylobacterium oxalidis]|uniref:Uncharacterized protein n=1 Tax=Methylobacterium oxalidis TaxID=944322 RepID=A0ABQ6DUR2_9HYPH|nr:hypothetical protein GCM10007888_62380 [Methylobacterium oxalidis]
MVPARATDDRRFGKAVTISLGRLREPGMRKAPGARHRAPDFADQEVRDYRSEPQKRWMR